MVGLLGLDDMPFSFIILTYNSASYINILIDSLINILGDEIKEGKVEVILFDNNSTDSTLVIAENYNARVSIHKSNINLGYAKGINEAAKFANGEYLVVINPDAKLIEFDFDKIKKEFEENQKLGIAGFPVSNFDGRKELTAGRFYNAFSFLLFSLGLESLIGQRFSSSKKQEVDFVSGGFVSFRKTLFKKLSGYDEDYFMYVEDMDICFRAKKEGYKTYLLPFAKALHKGQGSSNRQFAIISIYKGLQTFYKKNNAGLNLGYVKSLLRFKATLIIFVSSILGKKEILTTYKEAAKTLS